MKSRKNIKVEVKMFDNTKFKIIDTKPNRDTIHYIWFRCMILAGRSNKNGELYLCSSIPFTIETLALEFNRSEDEVKDALNVLIELKMMCVTKNNVFKVKNFNYYQNIKTESNAENMKEEQDDSKNKETIEIQKEQTGKNNSDKSIQPNGTKVTEKLQIIEGNDLKDENKLSKSKAVKTVSKPVKKKRKKAARKNNDVIKLNIDEEKIESCWDVKIDEDNCNCIASWSF